MTSALNITQTINAASGTNAGGLVEEYSALNMTITETDSAGFDKQMFIHCDGGTGSPAPVEKFRVDLDGDVTSAGTVTSSNGICGGPSTWTSTGGREIYGRYSSVNTYYISNQSLGTSIAAADFGNTSKWNYSQFTSIDAVKLESWYFVGEFSSSVDWELELWDVTIPANGTAAIATAARVGDTQSISATANAVYTLGETSLDYTVAAGHQLYILTRYVSGSSTKYSYGTATFEFNNG